MERREEAFPKIADWILRAFNLGEHLGLKFTLTANTVRIKCGSQEVTVKRYTNRGWVIERPGAWTAQVKAGISERPEQTKAIDHPEPEKVQ